MVTVLEQDMVNEIAELGRQASPGEACGLLLPMRIRGIQVIELPNHSDNPEDSFEMKGEDMAACLERIFMGEFPEELIGGLTAWHTHPSGGVGPSTADLHNKPAYLKSLVVTLFTDGRAPLATWY